MAFTHRLSAAPKRTSQFGYITAQARYFLYVLQTGIAVSACPFPTFPTRVLNRPSQNGGRNYNERAGRSIQKICEDCECKKIELGDWASHPNSLLHGVNKKDDVGVWKMRVPEFLLGHHREPLFPTGSPLSYGPAASIGWPWRIAKATVSGNPPQKFASAYDVAQWRVPSMPGASRSKCPAHATLQTSRPCLVL